MQYSRHSRHPSSIPEQEDLHQLGSPIQLRREPVEAIDDDPSSGMHEVRQRSNRILSVLRRFASYFEICFMRFELIKFSSRYGVTPLCDNIFYTRQTGNTCSGSLTLSQALLSMPSVRRPSTLHLDPQDAALAPQQTEGADLMSPVEVIALYIGICPLLSSLNTLTFVMPRKY
jgi:hypothetical protein